MRGATMLIIAGGLLLAGCSSSKLVTDLRQADDPCRDKDWPNKTALVSCLAAHERPVWAQEEPSTLDLYDDYARKRQALAQQRDQGSLTEEQYNKQLWALDHASRDKISERRNEEGITEKSGS
ncbi:MAG TPA: hypothetical protein VN668_08475 [Stellaceae bacterium]|nr:hypothetical protein [Stellaceae bacterium]